MNSKILIASCSLVLLGGCKKSENEEVVSYSALEKSILNDFTNVVALPNYLDLKTKASDLNTAIINLDNQTTDSNLFKVQDAWKNLRASWEQAEGWLFGPVEDMNFDPEIDDWPVNSIDLDSVLNGSLVLDLATIQSFQTSLKGFHPLEYLIFGVGGNKAASQLTQREREYMKALATHLMDVSNQIYNSWDTAQPGGYGNEVIQAGSGSMIFEKRSDAFITLVSAMAGICDEVANGKMNDPLIAQDSTLEESQFAKNSVTDFRNNIIGVENVYFGKYLNDGTGLNEWVAAKNLSLDNKLKQQISTAIASFNNISLPYGLAIYSQQVQIMNSQNAINDLKSTLEDELLPFIVNNMQE